MTRALELLRQARGYVAEPGSPGTVVETTEESAERSAALLAEIDRALAYADPTLLCARSDLDWLIGFLDVQVQAEVPGFDAALRIAQSAKAHLDAAMTLDGVESR
jgi:hypothetical protein